MRSGQVSRKEQPSNLADLVKEFRRRKWHLPNTRRVLGELLLHSSLALGGWALIAAHLGVWVSLLGLALSTAGSVGVATNSHTASHFAASRSRRTNQALTYFGFPLMTGISATSWWYRHCVLHHSSPNVIGADEDVDLWPVFATTRHDIERSNPLLRAYYSFQWLFLPFGVALNTLNMQRQGVIFLLGKFKHRGWTVPKHWYDLACLFGHYALWFVVPAFFDSPGRIATFYAVRLVLLGYAAFAIFTPGHFPEEARCTVPEHAARDFARRQTDATLNFRLPGFAGLFCSGLDHQIEHHLFPTLDHTRYRLIRPEVEAFCAGNGYAYRCQPWSAALRKAIGVFIRPRAVVMAAEVPRFGGQSAPGS
jgi:linoleoyl-CoA desaturase